MNELVLLPRQQRASPQAILAKVLATMQAKRYRAAAAMLLTGFEWNSVPGYTRDDWHRLWFDIDRLEPREWAPGYVPNKLAKSQVFTAYHAPWRAWDSETDCVLRGIYHATPDYR